MIELCCEYLSAWWICMLLSYLVQVSEWIHTIFCLNVKELPARSRHHIWSLSDSNGILTHNDLVCKWTLNHLAKLVKWLSCVVSTYPYCAFESRCSHLFFRYGTCFEQRAPWNLGNYRVWIHSKACAWHDKNIQLKNSLFLRIPIVLAQSSTLLPVQSTLDWLNKLY